MTTKTRRGPRLAMTSGISPGPLRLPLPRLVFLYRSLPSDDTPLREN